MELSKAWPVADNSRCAALGGVGERFYDYSIARVRWRCKVGRGSCVLKMGQW